jgi:excisionase family DNA binding protein
VEDLSVAEAASMLGVSDVRVRKMLSDGVLPGRHVGRVWLIPAAAVAELADLKLSAGRPMAPLRAWGLLDILDGGRAAWLEKVARSQVRAQLRRLEGGEPRMWRAALRGREERSGVTGHRLAIARLSHTDGVWPAGPATAHAAGADLVVVEPVPEFYVAAERWGNLASDLLLRPATGRPDAFVRIPHGRWPFGPAGPGRAALAASLLDCGDSRSARAAADVLNELAREVLG